MPDGSSSTPEEQRITRREFLKNLGLATGSLVAVSVVGQKALEWLGKAKTPETRPAYKGNIIVLDFAPENAVAGVVQESYPDNKSLAQKILGGNYITPQEYEEELRSSEGLSRRLLAKNPKASLLYGFGQQFQNHGLQVIEAMRRIGGVVGKNQEALLVPSQDVIDESNIKFKKDPYGNEGIVVDLNSQKIIQKIEKVREKYPDQKVLNLSLQVGETEIWRSPKNAEVIWPNQPTLFSFTENDKTYYTVKPRKEAFLQVEKDAQGSIIGFKSDDGHNYSLLSKQHAEVEAVKQQQQYLQTDEGRNPGDHEVSAYSRKNASKNVPGLFMIAGAFPDMVIIASAGNFDVDIRDLILHAPDNLIVVGQWDGTANKPSGGDVFGAHIYVDNQSLGIGNGTSLSVGINQLIVALLEKYPQNKIRSILTGNFSRSVTYETTDDSGSSGIENTFVLDASTLKK